MQIWIPKYCSPTNSTGIIPPSPPAERRIERDRIIRKEAPIRCPGISPMAWREWEQQRASMVINPFAVAASGFPAGATAHWEFEEAAGGPYVDATGRGNDLTATGSPTQDAGKVGTNAIVCSTGNFASRASTADLQAGLSGFTVIGWFFPTSSAARGYYSKATNGSTYEYYLADDTTINACYFAAANHANNGNANTPNVSGGGPARLTQNIWTMICAGYDNAQQKLFIAKNAGTRAFSGTIAGIWTSTTAFSVGKDTADSYNFAGRADSITIWNATLLTTTQEATVYNGGNGLAY